MVVHLSYMSFQVLLYFQTKEKDLKHSEMCSFLVNNTFVRFFLILAIQLLWVLMWSTLAGLLMQVRRMECIWL